MAAAATAAAATAGLFPCDSKSFNQFGADFLDRCNIWIKPLSVTCAA